MVTNPFLCVYGSCGCCCVVVLLCFFFYPENHVIEFGVSRKGGARHMLSIHLDFKKIHRQQKRNISACLAME